MTAGLVLQVVVTGLAAGAAYGLVAIGFALVHRLTGVLQLAHGDFAAGALFLMLFLVAGTDPITQTNVSWPLLLLAALGAVVVGAAFGAALYLLVVRPFFRRQFTIGWLGALVAVALTIEGGLAAAFPQTVSVVPDVFRLSNRQPISVGGGATIDWRTFAVLATGVALAGAAAWFLSRTRTGIAMTAIGDDPVAAQLSGLPLDRLVAGAFAIAGGLAAVAGIVAFGGSPVEPQGAIILGLKGIAAALLARLGRPGRVLAAALALGVLESVVSSLHVPYFRQMYLGPRWRDVGPLLVVIAALAFGAAGGAVEPVE
jgi:branched-subunit amino acid ABC-type transport system permease component